MTPPPPTARAYNPEFYFDTPNPIRVLPGSNYSYILQWTQKEPRAVDRILGYWINLRQVGGRCLCGSRPRSALICRGCPGCSGLHGASR